MRLTSTRLVLAMLCAGITSVAQASAHFVLVAQAESVPVVPAWRFDHHRHDPDIPKHWAEMNAKERAELWPLLEPRMQRIYWTSMTRKERLAMREHLPSRYEYSIRHRYTSPPPKPGHDAKKGPAHRLSPEERARMRQQIQEMHVEFYEFRRHQPRNDVQPIPGAGMASGPRPDMPPAHGPMTPAHSRPAP